MDMPKLDGVHIKITLKDFDAIIRSHGFFRSWEYIKDRHFEYWAFDSIQSKADAIKFADELDADRKAPCGERCSKSDNIRHWLVAPWTELQENITEDGYPLAQIRSALAASRRICCGCHETGSYALKTKSTL